MKSHTAVYHTLSVVVTGLFLAVIAGCQDSSVTSPTTDLEPSTRMRLRQQPKTVVLPLDQILRVPGRVFRSYATINGSVVCSFTSTPQKNLYLLDVDLATQAILMLDGNDKIVSRVSGSSHEKVYVSAKGIALLEKSYRVEGPMKQFTLHVRFLFTSDGIRLNGIWLEQIRIAIPDADGY